MTNERAKLGCFSMISLLGCFGTGFYRGLHNNDPNLQINNILMYAFPLVQGYVSNQMAHDVKADPSTLAELESKVDERFSNVPWQVREQAKEQSRGCMTVGWAVMGTALGAAVEGAGYYIGTLCK